MEANQASFLIRAVYDVLPSPTNLNQWYGEDPICPLCPFSATQKHILVGCKASLSQGRYTWQHNQVQRCLAASLESKITAINALPPPPPKTSSTITFITAGTAAKRVYTSKLHPGLLRGARDWNLLVEPATMFPP